MEMVMYIFAAVGLYVVAGMVFTIINAIILQSRCNRSKVANENLSDLIKEEQKKKEWKRDLDWINHRK